MYKSNTNHSLNDRPFLNLLTHLNHTTHTQHASTLSTLWHSTTTHMRKMSLDFSSSHNARHRSVRPAYTPRAFRQCRFAHSIIAVVVHVVSLRRRAHTRERTRALAHSNTHTHTPADRQHTSSSTVYIKSLWRVHINILNVLVCVFVVCVCVCVYWVAWRIARVCADHTRTPTVPVTAAAAAADAAAAAASQQPASTVLCARVSCGRAFYSRPCGGSRAINFTKCDNEYTTQYYCYLFWLQLYVCHSVCEFVCAYSTHCVLTAHVCVRCSARSVCVCLETRANVWSRQIDSCTLMLVIADRVCTLRIRVCVFIAFPCVSAWLRAVVG